MDRRVGRLVGGVVVRHEHYGFFVDIGDAEDGVVVVTMVEDDPEAVPAHFPPVGAEIVAVLLGYTDLGGQPRLSVRPMDIAAAEAQAAAD